MQTPQLWLPNLPPGQSLAQAMTLTHHWRATIADACTEQTQETGLQDLWTAAGLSCAPRPHLTANPGHLLVTRGHIYTTSNIINFLAVGDSLAIAFSPTKSMNLGKHVRGRSIKLSARNSGSILKECLQLSTGVL